MCICCKGAEEPRRGKIWTESKATEIALGFTKANKSDILNLSNNEYQITIFQQNKFISKGESYHEKIRRNYPTSNREPKPGNR